MRIAFVSQTDPTQVSTWSGTPYFIVRSLRQRGHEVETVGPLDMPFPSLMKNYQRLKNRLGKHHYDITRTAYVAKAFARQAEAKLVKRQFDLILSPSSVVTAYLETDSPMVTWEDATFAGMVGYYPGNWMNLSSSTIEDGNDLQQRAIARAALSVYASEWAASSALTHYKADPARIRCIPLGANLETPPTHEEVAAAIAGKQSAGECRLLFIGVEWKRKGGDIVIETARQLQRHGVKVTVDIVGCSPPHAVPDFVRLHGFVSKASEAGRQKIQRLLLDAHYLFVPSTAECYGLVFAEASAYGVPSLARATGGIPSVVCNGQNGWAFPMDAAPKAFADYILQEFDTPSRYDESAHRARQLFEATLNWDTAITALEQQVQTEIGSTSFATSCGMPKAALR